MECVNLKMTLAAVAAVAAMPALADGKWTLERCMEHAVEHNIEVRQFENVRRRQQVQLSTDRNSMLPGVSGSVAQNFSFGRGLTADNTYTDTNTSSTSFSLSASLPLFTGLRISNSIKQSRLNLEAATADLEKARNDIRMRVAQAYVQILFAREVAAAADSQVRLDSLQLHRLQALSGSGRASAAEVSQQNAALEQSRLQATQAASSVTMALLDLSQLLELPSAEGFDIEVPDVAGLLVGPESLPSAGAVYAEASALRPEVEAERLRLKAAERGVSIARSAYMPQLSLNAGLGTNYYKTSGFGAASFSDQMRNNFSQYVGLSLTVPVFNRLQTRNSVRTAKLVREAQMLTLDNVRKTLYKEIQQVCCNAVAAAAKYRSSVAAEAAGADAFELATAKYENGKAGITEYNEAKTNLLKARCDLSQARFEYLYQLSLIDFYRGKALAF